METEFAGDAATTVPVAPTPSATSNRRRGRPPKDGRRAIELRGSVIKRYVLSSDDECTIGHLRRIVAQREIPGSAHITFEDSHLTIEWTAE
jgi:hypothetical protein